MSLGSELRRKLVAQNWTENPLRVIGLSPEILRLGLADDDLYDLVRRMARDIFAKYHPDRSDGATEVAQRFGEALEFIKDRATFDAALAEFRTSGNSFMSELQHAKDKVQKGSERIEVLESQIDGVKKELQTQKVLLDRTKRFINMAALKFPTSEGPPADSWERISFGHTVSLPDATDVYVATFLVSGYGSGEGRGYSTSEASELCLEVAKLKHPSFPVVRWSALKFKGLAGLAYGRRNPKKIEQVTLPQAPRTLPALYRQGLTLIARMLKGVPLAEIGVVINHFSVRRLMLKESNEIVLGTIPAHYLEENKHQWKLAEGKIQISNDLALASLMPFFQQGDLLVTRSPSRLNRASSRAGWKATEALLEKAPFEVRHLLLFVR